MTIATFVRASQQTTTVSTQVQARANRPPPALWHNNALAALAGKLSTMVGTWIARSRERRMLWELAETNDQHTLKDIGVTREQAQHTAAKWFWQP